MCHPLKIKSSIIIMIIIMQVIACEVGKFERLTNFEREPLRYLISFDDCPKMVFIARVS